MATLAPDVNVFNNGTTFSFLIWTQAARQWVAQNVQNPMFLGNNLVVDQRYARALADGMQADGLRLK